MNQETLRLFLAGPLILLFVVSCLATTALAAAGTGRVRALAALEARAVGRLERGRALPTLWGLSAGVLLFTGGAVLSNRPALALLGVLVLLAGLVLAGLGVGAASIVLGRALLGALDPAVTSTLACLRIGLGVFFGAAFLPFVGWALVGLAAASGLGALLEALFERRNDKGPGVSY